MSTSSDIVMSARNGDADALLQLRESLSNDPSIANPHYIDVRDDGFLSDGSWFHRLSRRDMFPDIPRFTKDRWGFSASEVINVVQKYPSLIDKFAAAAYKEIDQLETQLVCDELLHQSDQAKLIANIARLSSDRAPIWQNWIHEHSEKNFVSFDSLVHDWLEEPLDWTERELFDPVKSEKWFNVQFARDFFAQIPQDIRDFVGVTLVDGTLESTGESIKCAYLEDTIAQANQRAKALNVKFRFRKFE